MSSGPGLTALQRRIRRIVGELPPGTGLAIAGGGALIVSGVIDRPTTDLDFFAPARNLAHMAASPLRRDPCPALEPAL